MSPCERKKKYDTHHGSEHLEAPITMELAGLETYQQVFHSSPDFISVSRLRDGLYIDVNPGFERFTGFRRGEVIGRTSMQIGVWPGAEERQRVISAMHAAGGELHEFPSRLCSRNGEIRHVEMSASLIGAGEERLLIVIVRDINERHHTEIELQQYREHLEVLVGHRTAALHEANLELLETNRQLNQAHERLLETERRMHYMALHDVLTGLPNRALLHDRVAQAISQAERDGTLMALLFIDLDRFKQVNDTMGHLAGDTLLRSVAQRLRQVIRKSDTVARLSGDEFVICASQLENTEHAGQLAQKIQQQLEAPFMVSGQQLHATVSIGIGMYPADGHDTEELMRAADTAMYHAKDRGRAHHQYYTPALNAAVQRRMSIEAALRQALPREEFILHYQPQVEISSGRIVAVEALIRWMQPSRGLVSPLEFIPIAEETGLILRIGEWVLREACAQLKRWHAAGHAHLGMAVNLSARQIQQPGFAEMVADILEETGVPPAALDLELTESMLMHPVAENNEPLQRLAAMGVRLSVDDFGTGYSSLAYLRHFPIHTLKIDRSFVHGLAHNTNDRAITQTIIGMARTLGLSVIAEGVETAEQAALLAAQHCTLAQGYYYGMPGDAASCTARLNGTVAVPV